MTPASRRHILLLLLLIPVGTAMAQTSASHRVVVGIEPITVMAISGDPMPLFGVLEPGRTTTVQDATTYYNLTTNVDRVHLEARLEEPLPPGVQLQLWVESSIGSSLGGVRLDDSTRPRRLINNMRRGLENGRRIEYTLVVDPDAGAIPFQSRLVTLSLVNPETGYRQELQQVLQFSVQAPETGTGATN